MKIIIIGAGQLGSRHLQALKQVPFNLQIMVCDPSEQSLQIAKERFDSVVGVKTSYEISYETETPKSGSWDLAIIASSAAPRRKIMEQISKQLDIKKFIIEKILFTSENDYLWAQELQETYFKKSWVNCCMRQMPVYKDIRTTIGQKKFHMSVVGSQFGFITNAIHYLDYAAALAGTSEYTLLTKYLDKQVIPSKRAGYVELSGTLVAQFENGSTVSLTCLSTGQLPVTVEIQTGEERFVVLEAERKYLHWSQENNWQRQEKEAVIPYQSQLTTELVQLLHEEKGCTLPSLKESIEVHLNLLKPLKKFLEDNKLTQTNDYPFT